MHFWTNYDKIPITSDDLFYLEDDNEKEQSIHTYFWKATYRIYF